MTIAHVQTAPSGYATSASPSATLGVAPTEGNTLIWLIHANGTPAITPPPGFTQLGSDYDPPGKTARVAAYIKEAGASESATQTGSIASGRWHVDLLEFSSASSLALSLAVLCSIQGANETKVTISAFNGRSIGAGELSIGFGGKDTFTSQEGYTVANNSHTAFGDMPNQLSAGAWRVYVSGETTSSDLTIEPTDASDGVNDLGYGIHFTLTEGSNEVTSSGTPAADDAATAGTAERELTSSGTPAADAGATAGTAEREMTSSGTLAAVASTTTGTATIQVKIELTAAQGQELRDENGAVVANLANIAYEWYDKTSDTDGNPVQSGTLSTNASGEATLQLPSSALTSGQFGTLVLNHPTDLEISGKYYLAVT